MSPQERRIIEDQIDLMQRQSLKRPSTSPWASPTVLAPKKDGSTRFCVDYRRLNKCTEKDRYPLPRISDLLEALEGKNFFSLIDAAAGYWQIPVEAEFVVKTPFSTHWGLFEYIRKPFGLCNAPATYQRFMDGQLSGLLWTACFNYIDAPCASKSLSRRNCRTREAFRANPRQRHTI